MSATSTPGPLPPDVNRGFELLIVSWTTLSLALLLVSLRLYIRAIVHKNLGWDFYLILLSIVFAVAQCIFATLQVHNGFGRNIQYITPSQLQHFGLYTNVTILLHTVGTALVRISVCLFVLRLVPAIQVSYRRWIWGVLVLNAVVSLAVFLAFCFQCIPLSALWDPSVKARCFPRTEMTKIAQFQGGAAAVTDLLCVLLPMLLFRTLKASLRDKVAIFLILGLGFFTAATAVARTVLLDLQSKNITWDNLPVGIWAWYIVPSFNYYQSVHCSSSPTFSPTFASLVPSNTTNPSLQPRTKHRNSRCLHAGPPPTPHQSQKETSHSSGTLCDHSSNSCAHINSFPRLPYNDCIRLPDNDGSPKESSDQFSKPTPMMTDIESHHNKRGSLVKIGMGSQPIWTDRKISVAETVEMSRICPTPTFVERKPSAAETLRLSMVTPSWGGHSKSSSTEKLSNNRKRLSMVSPMSLDKPAPLFSARKMQQPGRFQETGLRMSRVATPEELVTLGNPAAMGYSCTIEGGTPKTSPKSPKFPNS